MTVSAKTRTITIEADRELDLAGSLIVRIAVPPNTLSARVVVHKTANGSWGGSIPIESEHGAYATPVVIADPGSSVLSAHAALGVDALDGHGYIVLKPISSGSGSVRASVVFTVVDGD